MKWFLDNLLIISKNHTSPKTWLSTVIHVMCCAFTSVVFHPTTVDTVDKMNFITVCGAPQLRKVLINIIVKSWAHTCKTSYIFILYKNINEPIMERNDRLIQNTWQRKFHGCMVKDIALEKLRKLAAAAQILNVYTCYWLSSKCLCCRFRFSKYPFLLSNLYARATGFR